MTTPVLTARPTPSAPPEAVMPLDRVDAQHLKRVELLADLARTQIGGDGRAGHPGQDDRRRAGTSCPRLLASTPPPEPLCQHSITDCDTHPHSCVHSLF